MSGNYHTESDINERMYHRSCRGKRRFVSKKIARGMLRTLLRREAERDDGRNRFLGVYNCRACRTWHIGHFRDAQNAAESRG